MSRPRWPLAAPIGKGGLKLEISYCVGGVVSPLLANIYLHEVVDRWFEEEVKPRLGGHAVLIRYADDLVIAFAEEKDAHRVAEVLPKRLARFGLQLHPEKTRLVPFQKPRDKAEPPQSEGPGAFTFLGFTHYSGKSRKGNWVIQAQDSRESLHPVVEQSPAVVPPLSA